MRKGDNVLSRFRALFLFFWGLFLGFDNSLYVIISIVGEK